MDSEPDRWERRSASAHWRESTHGPSFVAFQACLRAARRLQRLGQREKIRIPQVGGDGATSELLLLDATHVAKGIVSEDDGDGRDPVHGHRGELVQAEPEAAVAIDRNHRLVWMRDLRSQRGREAISKRALIARG